ncbi:MAG: hypothetical protein SGI97_11085, partial [candidate division Zixibacteria bacterium]|nr:hypothetical protein [candidate division Zixibacteria bacterium]
MYAVFYYLIIVSVLIALSNNPRAQDDLNYRRGVHKEGNLQIVLNHTGEFLTGGDSIVDPLTGRLLNGLGYPRSSGIRYLSGRLTVGAIIDQDTQCVRFGGYEFHPSPASKGLFKYSTIDPQNTLFSSEAKSELDLVCEYVDTGLQNTGPILQGNDPLPHKPLGIGVIQRSMSWTGPHVDDFILINYSFQNICAKKLSNVFIGIEFEGYPEYNYELFDTIGGGLAGFLRDWSSSDGCEFRDTVDLAYIIEQDGNPVAGQFTEKSPRGAVGIKLLRSPESVKRRNFNWWEFNGERETPGGFPLFWGPRTIPQPDERFRKLGPHLGLPYGDANYYYLMSHREFDYDQMFTAVNHSVDGFLPPPENATNYADGQHPTVLYSFGSFDMSPGDVAEFTIAIVGGDSIHVNPDDYKNLFDPANPTPYYNSLDFSQLANNAR